MTTRPNLKRCSQTAAGCLLLTAFLGTTQAMFMPPELVPVERLAKNAAAYLATHPAEADAHYTLARIHYLAFASKRATVPALHGEEGGKPRPAPNWMVGMTGGRGSKEEPAGARLSEALLGTHAAQALKGFQEALRLDPKNGLYALGLASLLEEVSGWQQSAKPADLPAELRDIPIGKIREAYAQAFSLAMVKDAKLQSLPIEGLAGIVANEAATALIRLSQAPGAPLSAAEKATLEEARQAAAKFAKLPMRMVTPMVFALQPAAHLSEWLAPEKQVDFDLRGYGAVERWPWVKPELGFVVWDPQEKGDIRSSRQMFGGYSFQIFRATGYDALAALDDNADGVLSGAELEGLSAWFDLNGDGHSTPGEVRPLRELDVVSIATKAEGFDSLHPTHPQGLILGDGRALPTWDWMIAPVAGSQ